MAKFLEEIEVTCPECNSGQVVKVGKRNGHQRFKCQTCKKKFRISTPKPEHKVFNSKFDAEQIGAIIRMHYMGMSYTQIAELMRDLYDIEPSTDTLYNIVEQFTHKASCMMDGLKAHTSDKWHADETWTDVGGKTCYHWNIIDSGTRYVLASHISERKDAEAARAVIKKALKAAHKPPKVFVTDGNQTYNKPLAELMPGTKHLRAKNIYQPADKSNNRSERMQNTFRSRTKTLRGLHSLDTAQRWLDGFNLTYNFFRQHKAIKKRPGDAAKVDFPAKEWADVVKADFEYPKLERIPTPRARKGMANKKVRRAELRKRHREERKRKTAQDKVNRKQYRLMPSELDEAIKAKLKPAAVMPTIPKGHQFKLEPIKGTNKGKPSALKPEPPKLASTRGWQQYDLMGKMVPAFMRKPRPAGSKRH